MGKKKPVTPNTALMLVPRKTAWGPLQEIRRHHDSSHTNWPPHITLFRPFERNLDAVAGQIASVLERHAPILACFSQPECLNAYGTVVVKPNGSERQIRDLHLELCHVLPEYVREAFVKNMAKHSKDGKEAFIQKAAGDFLAAHSEVFIPHLTVAQFETQAEAEDFVRREAGLEIEVELEVVLLQREVEDTPMRFEYVFREGRMMHTRETYHPEAHASTPGGAEHVHLDMQQCEAQTLPMYCNHDECAGYAQCVGCDGSGYCFDCCESLGLGTKMQCPF